MFFEAVSLYNNVPQYNGSVTCSTIVTQIMFAGADEKLSIIDYNSPTFQLPNMMFAQYLKAFHVKAHRIGEK